MPPIDYSIGVLPWVFLGGGLVLGLVAVVRLRSQPTSGPTDLLLLRTDLEAQREELFARLAAEADEELTSNDRQLLELQAAKVLQQLEALPASGELTASPPKGTGVSKNKTAPARGVPRGFWARHPAAAGALLGGGIVALVAILILVVMDEATPQQTGAMGPPQNVQDSPAQAPGSASQPPLPPFLAQQVGQMRDALKANPEDLATRRQLALTLLSADHAFDAFQEANIVLQTAPNDPQALYITGFVRYFMGQPAEAIAQFDRAIQAAPEYSQPWLVKGLIQLQTQPRSFAIETWQKGLEAVGGTEPRLEHLIREAKTSKTVDEILANPP